MAYQACWLTDNLLTEACANERNVSRPSNAMRYGIFGLLINRVRTNGWRSLLLQTVARKQVLTWTQLCQFIQSLIDSSVYSPETRLFGYQRYEFIRLFAINSLKKSYGITIDRPAISEAIRPPNQMRAG